MTDDTPMDLTPEERARVETRHVVEALAETLWRAWNPNPSIAVHDWNEVDDMFREPFRSMARAALAFALTQMPSEEELMALVQPIQAVAIHTLLLRRLRINGGGGIEWGGAGAMYMSDAQGLSNPGRRR